ncbi:MAG TPA: Hsp20/alpha crystallin family protein [candidate division Zixibacteria bacterium]|nr:Hsp20/alpha crystallin family protein [candidate division Zixibacteria bacterium]
MADERKWLSVPADFQRLSDAVDRLFDEIIHRPWGFSRPVPVWSPSIDLSETPDAYVLEVDLPGVKKEDVKVELEGRDLILRGERSSERTQSGYKFHFQERYSGAFMRRMTLPDSVDKDAIEAEFKEGVLRVTLPKVKKSGGGRNHG